MKFKIGKVRIVIFLAVLFLIILGASSLVDTPIGNSFEEGFNKGYKFTTE